MKRNKRNKKGFTKLEKFIYKSFTMLGVFLLVGIVFTSAVVSKMNIESQEDTNQSLTMKINEMASLENIQGVSENLGLAYNNDNIKTIE